MKVIDLTSTVKQNERELSERQAKIESLQAEIIALQHDLKGAEATIAELESTNQLLKVREVYVLDVVGLLSKA